MPITRSPGSGGEGHVGEVPLVRLVEQLGPRARLDEPMRDYTAIRTGGAADALVICETVADLMNVVALAREYGAPWLVLGGGCNVLVADGGIRGLVIICRTTSVEIDRAARLGEAVPGRGRGAISHTVRAEAGASFSGVARATVSTGLAGLEWASGLPGSVGGAVVGNAGAFEGDVAGSLVSADVLAPDGDVYERSAEWFHFDYRTSCLKSATTDRYLLLAATFALQQAESAGLAAKADEILTWRRTRHPAGSTMGSTFKNPPGSHAGYLIEQAGLRGHRIGGAEVSPLHGNFFMNTGSATSSDVLALVDHVKSEVIRQFGIELELEIELIGW